jgi:hypothetical protein
VLPAEGFLPTLTKLVDVLEEFNIRFHLTGGITAVAYGEPRMTQDVDLVLDPERVPAVQAEFLRALTEAGFYFSDSTAAQAIAKGKMFQLLDIEQVIKLDLYVRCLIPGELERSVRVELFPDVELPIVARPDAALSKLIWIEHGSHRSRRDLRMILAGATQDERSFVRRTAGEMGLTALLDEVLAEDDELDV